MKHKIYYIILVLVVLLVVLVAVIYAAQPDVRPEVGVKVGDVFTYKMVGVAEWADEGVAIPNEFIAVNSTDYYRIQITGVESTNVSYTEITQFHNGTSYIYDGAIDVATGASSGEGSFWGIYAINLAVGKQSRPDYAEGAEIDSVEIVPYSDGDRTTNFMSVSGTFYDMDDETYSTTYESYAYIYFDKELGVLVALQNRQIYNNPQIMLTVYYVLVESNVLQVDTNTINALEALS
ncbi:MAG: hypothetical protein FWH37_02240 [Candidatus Bathyarchaeota archaeon]|nr:hypothetical protein [Candidatus Termiticorpusculum sp.]